MVSRSILRHRRGLQKAAILWAHPVYFGINKVPVAGRAPLCGLQGSKKTDVLLSLAFSCSPYDLRFEDETLRHHLRFSPPLSVPLAFSFNRYTSKKKKNQKPQNIFHFYNCKLVFSDV